MNGAAVEAELNHHFLMELPWLAFLVDLLIGWTLAWICIRQLNGSVRWLFGLSAAAAFVLYTLSRNLAGQHIAWYSWVGAIGGLLVGFVIHALMHRGEAAHN